MKIAIVSKSGRNVCYLNASSSATIRDVKALIHKQKRNLYPDRQLLKLCDATKLKDEQTLGSLNISDGSTLLIKDLGPQIGWSTVFLAEYAGPLICYLLFYPRPELVYGEGASTLPRLPVVDIAAMCWSFHYIKRVLETIFVHRFSHATMPIMSLFKNCSYYWGFACMVSYFVNHPLFTSPSVNQVYIGLAMFIFCELGNLSIHVSLRNLRPAGSKTRKIPFPTANPFTLLFHFVACPNYTYEVGAWIGFTIMTSTLTAALFALAGFIQMSIWALGKRRNYKKEFGESFPRRKAIVPFLL